ncbi:hypothetical protein HELRODRAFT_192030 [Helobdella robusta]|uniref:C-type lectin domain-containing protein n=1 Tax=Helobdella robusta TaxID=6412 RepID=T1FTI7_HELRO|nr:hypothetical protein HELRODRAFT_192030 [Helobdella robusta]ESO03417.1 hypothetical protein HELRODRAFT_192030 [Helobdella robusta]
MCHLQILLFLITSSIFLHESKADIENSACVYMNSKNNISSINTYDGDDDHHEIRTVFCLRQMNISVDGAKEYCKNNSMNLLDFKNESMKSKISIVLQKYFNVESSPLIIPLDARRIKTMDQNESKATALQLSWSEKNGFIINYIPVNKSEKHATLLQTKKLYRLFKTCQGIIINNKCFYVSSKPQNLSNTIADSSLIHIIPSPDIFSRLVFKNLDTRTYWFGEALYTWFWKEDSEDREEFTVRSTSQNESPETEETECMFTKYNYVADRFTWKAAGCNATVESVVTVICHADLPYPTTSSSKFLYVIIVIAVIAGLLVVLGAVLRKKLGHRLRKRPNCCS